jgi:hypothetical protein
MKPTNFPTGLTKTLYCLTKAGIPIAKEAILKALTNGILYPHRCPRDYGKYTHREVCRWVGFDESTSRVLRAGGPRKLPVTP